MQERYDLCSSGCFPSSATIFCKNDSRLSSHTSPISHRTPGRKTVLRTPGCCRIFPASIADIALPCRSASEHAVAWADTMRYWKIVVVASMIHSRLRCQTYHLQERQTDAFVLGYMRRSRLLLHEAASSCQAEPGSMMEDQHRGSSDTRQSEGAVGGNWAVE